MKFYGRENELDILRRNEAQSFSHASFTVLMGRRRIGKTSLIMQAFRNISYAYLFVSRDNETILCQKFQQELSSQCNINVYGTVTSFKELFEIIMRESLHRHITVVIDEFQNLYRINPSIFSDIQNIWDTYHRESKINLIVCGSIHSLMKRIFEDRAEPLYGRPTSKFILRAFSINVLKQILADANPSYNPEDLLCLYMVTGGVAKYVELLVDAQCCTKDKILDYVCRQDSYFITEGRDLLSNEFSSDFNTYFSILQVIANGQTRRVEIDNQLQRDTGTFLSNLEKNYEMLSRILPIFAKPNSKTTKYEIRDNFLRFWFRFIFPYQSLIERQQLQLVRQNISANYEQFSGRTLELYFQELMMESGQYTEIGNWWSRNGENEIDIVAINEFSRTGVIAEVKRNPRKISISALEAKVNKLPKSDFGKYQFTLQALSLNEM